MKSTRRWTRMLALAVALALPVSATFAPSSVRAQEPGMEGGAEGGETSSGRPLDGYFGTSLLAFLALFLVAKSARR